MIPAYPKIFAIGTVYIKDIFNDSIEITEKIDGSQFAFGKIKGNVVMRSKNTILYPETADRMFWPAMEYVDSIVDRLPNNIVFYTEYLRHPKHNSIRYDITPKNHLALFGVYNAESDMFLQDNLREFAGWLCIDIAPVLYSGRVDSIDILKTFLSFQSYLGGSKVEGIVVKNYEKRWIIGDRPMPLMAGKLVSESFKEVNRHVWAASSTTNKIDAFYKSFRTVPRWEKALQRAREDGWLKRDLSDIGKLIRSIHEDIEIEEEAEIKNFLYREFSGNVMRASTAGFAEWYKTQLADGSF